MFTRPKGADRNLHGVSPIQSQRAGAPGHGRTAPIRRAGTARAGSVKRTLQPGWLGLLTGCGESAVEGDGEGVQGGLRAWSSGPGSLPVRSRLMMVMQTHFKAAVSFGKCPRALTARRLPDSPVAGDLPACV